MSAADLSICVDCAMLHANGETTVIEGERLTAVLAGLDAHPFLIVGDATGFSWTFCDACDSSLGGDRFEAWDVSR